MTETVGAAKLAISADAEGVEAGVGKAKKSLATLGGAAKAAGKEASDGLKQVGDGGDEAARKVTRATRQIEAALQRAVAAAEAGGRGTSKSFEALAGIRGADVNALRPLLDQLDALEKKQKSAAAASLAVAPAVAQVGMSAKATAAALRGVPAQFTDIVTAIQGGQAPMTVFLQQGGQLKDMFGGVGPAARALGGYLLGLINPLTVGAAAVGVLGLAYFQGAKEGDAFAKAIILSGNAAGLTVGQLQEMARRISDVSGTQGAAAEALALFVANGTLAGDSIERFTALALRMERDTGQAVSETVKQFAALGKDPVEAASKLNEQTNFLTASIAHQIRMLEDQGKTSDAARVAQEAYASTLEQRLGAVEQRLGTLQRAWRGIVGAAKDAWDAMLNVGREQTTESEIDRLRKQLADREKRGPLNPQMVGAFDKGNETLRERIAFLAEQNKFDRQAAQNAASEAERGKARLEFDKAGAEFATKREKMEREIAKAREKGAAAGATQVEIDKRIADIRKKFEDKSAANSALRLDRADLGLDIERIKDEAEKLVGIYSGAERRIDSLRSMGLLADGEYYEAKRAFIRLEADAKADALQKEIARFQQEKLTGAEKLQNDKKIADAEAKLAILRADTSSKLEAQSDLQIQATKREAAEFLAARQAAEGYFDATARRQELELSGLGKGNRQRGIDRGAFDIRERFTQERDRLANVRSQQEVAGTFTADDRRRYEERLSLLDEFEARELTQWQRFNDRKLAAEHDWLAGAQEGLKNYSEQAGNTAANVEQFFTHSFSAIEDAIANFVATGKLKFSDLVRSILADMARLSAREAASGFAKFLAGAFSSAVGGAVGGSGYPDDMPTRGGRAIGGPVSAGGMYQVNERGRPELLNVGGKQFLMMGAQGGKVAPAGDGGITIVNNTSAPIGRATQQRTPDGDRVLVLDEVAASLHDPNSKVSQALLKSYNTSRRR